MLDGLDVLRSTVTHPWESLGEIVDKYGEADLGDPQSAGTPAWHLRHIVETFQLHATTVSQGELAFEKTLPAQPTKFHGVLLRDVDRFIEWARNQSPERLSQPFEYNRPMDAQEMLGVMVRHIIWHSAAVHYLLVRRDRSDS